LVLNCFKCHAEVVFDSDHIGKNGKKIPLDPSTRQPHDCPMREKKVTSTVATGTEQHDWKEFAEDKDDHGNETYDPIKETQRFSNVLSTEDKKEYVDHTAKGQSKLKIFYSDIPSDVEQEYNDFLSKNNGRIKVQGGQFQSNQNWFAIALYYEEVKA
jgi:hypothetical protein